MGRMKFNSYGRIESVDAGLDDFISNNYEKDENEIHLKTSKELEFLKEEGENQSSENFEA